MATDELILCVNTECPSRNICKRFTYEVESNRAYSAYRFDDVKGCHRFIRDETAFEKWFSNRIAK